MTDDQKRKMASPVELFLFIRADGFYPLELPRDTVSDNAKCNPGTLRVEDSRGNVVWREGEKQ